MSFASVNDAASNSNENIDNAARAIGKSDHKQRVFSAVHHGKKSTKTVSEIASETGLTPKQVLDAAKPLVKKQLFKQVKIDGQTGYEKNSFLQAHKAQVLRLASNKKALEAYPTKRNVSVKNRVSVAAVVKVARLASVTRLSLEELPDFRKAHKISPSQERLPDTLTEDQFRKGIQAILGEPGEFKDWGGETDDLYTSRLLVGGKRRAAAFAFKGPSVRRKLHIKDMGKNADQGLRLFNAPADVFVVQHWREIDESVYSLVEKLAIQRGITKPVWFWVLDGKDCMRIYEAYRSCFE